jgi:hypothetical protein
MEVTRLLPWRFEETRSWWQSGNRLRRSSESRGGQSARLVAGMLLLTSFGLAAETSAPAPTQIDQQEKVAWRQLVDRQAAEYQIVAVKDGPRPLGPPKVSLRERSPGSG